MSMHAGYRPSHVTVFAMVVFVFLVLFTMLLPGYVLTLDMVWAPEMHFLWSEEGFNNTVPVRALIAGITLYLPGWVSQKVMFVALFSLLLYVPFRFLPPLSRSPNEWIRLFAALTYAVNPFVYARMLAGQWTLLFGYAFLPLVLFMLLRFVQSPSVRTGVWLGVSLSIVGVFSVHLLFIAGIMTAIALVLHIDIFLDKARTTFSNVLKGLASAITVALLISSFWIVPSLLRTAPVEESFDTAHFEAFAAAGEEHVPTILNLAVLGGFWAEDNGWSQYFVWPQQSMWFWTGMALLWLLVALGAYLGLKTAPRRRETILLLSIGAVAIVLASGAAETPFRMLNLWLYEKVPYWAGLRDSQKLIVPLALSYAILAGRGLFFILEVIRLSQVPQNDPEKDPQKNIGENKWISTVAMIALLIPASLGLYVWGGFQKQLEPVWYPASWREAKEILYEEDGIALVLPWEGYFSIPFANQLVVSNLAPRYFGADQTVSSRSVNVGEVYDQESDPAYRTLDTMIRNESDPEKVWAVLHESGITHLLFIPGITVLNADFYPFLEAVQLTALHEDEFIHLYRLDMPYAQ